MSDRITPFSNGTEFMVWRDYNCDRCAKDCPHDGNGNYGEPLCDIEVAIAYASVDDGQIDKTIADRAGLPVRGGEICQCPEFEAEP